jgi:rhodanese-related sulfurtransferase
LTGELTLIDVYIPAGVDRGGIFGARHISLFHGPTRVRELDNDKPIVFYCQRGNRSAIDCAFVVARRWNKVFNPRGGILGWWQGGQSLSRVIN